MRFREVFRYELEYRLRRPLTWIFFAIQALLTFWTNLATFDEPSVHFNAPVRLAAGLAIAGMAGILITAAVFGDAALRDVDAEMDSLLFTSPLSKLEYLGGRFLAALVINVMILLAIPLMQLFIAHGPLLGPEDVGAFRAAATLQPFLLFSLPNLVLIGAILFTIAALSRQTIPVYLGAIGFFVGYLVAVGNLEGVDSPMAFALGDPLGVGGLQRITKYWTPVESNTRLIGFPALLVSNRLIWLAVTAAVLALLHRRFHFAHSGAGGRRKNRRAIVAPGPERAAPVRVPRVRGTFTLRTRVRQVLAVLRHSLEEVALSRAFLACLVAAMGIAVLFGWNVGESPFDTSTWPVTYLVAEEVMARRTSPIIVLLLALFAGELVWKDRDVGAAEMADAAPVPVGALLLGRFLALMVMLVALQTAFTAAGILLQTLQGYYHFELALYVKILFGLSLLHWALIAALAMAVHVIVNQKYLGHVIVILAFVFTMTAPFMRVYHKLLIYGKDPGWIYSDMNGFGPFLGPFFWFKLYWAAWALLLAVVANLLWVRGRETRLRHRLLEARARFAGAVARTAGVAVALILLFGGFVFYNTNVLNDYRSPDEVGRPQAQYERRYKRYDDASQPTITAVKMRAEIYPNEPAVDVAGTYRMINRTSVAIDSIHVLLLNRGIQAKSISFDRGSTAVVADDETGYRIYALERPLEPGDSLQLAFDVSFRPRGFGNDQPQKELVENGTAFNRRWLPAIGYQPWLELFDERARKRFGLEARRPPAPNDSGATQRRWLLRNEDLVDLDVTIGTESDQVAITPGVLRRSWTENGRRYFHYQSEPPSMFGGDVFSGKWAVREDRWNDVKLQIFHHSTDSANLERTLRGMKTTLSYLTQEFGPYPYSHLRLIEIPRYEGFGRAMANTITFTEDYFKSRVKEGEVDLPFYGTAHEVGHQWWGGMLKGAFIRGHGLLSESLANYTAMVLTEKTYGPEAGRKVYDFQMERYLLARAEQSREVAALDVEDQPYIAYRKGAIAMYTLREHIGEEAVSRALRRYVEKFRGAGPPYPTSRDLYAELRAVTPDSLQPLLYDLFETITLWNVRMERAVSERTDAGEYRVTIDVHGWKARADGMGNQTEVPMDDLVEIGVFASGEGDALGAPLYLTKHRLKSGKQTIVITVPREPARAGIDPYGKLIDRDRNDNVFEVRRERE